MVNGLVASALPRFIISPSVTAVSHLHFQNMKWLSERLNDFLTVSWCIPAKVLMGPLSSCPGSGCLTVCRNQGIPAADGAKLHLRWIITRSFVLTFLTCQISNTGRKAVHPLGQYKITHSCCLRGRGKSESRAKGQKEKDADQWMNLYLCLCDSWGETLVAIKFVLTL